jgi:hypothetical protein
VDRERGRAADYEGDGGVVSHCCLLLVIASGDVTI